MRVKNILLLFSLERRTFRLLLRMGNVVSNLKTSFISKCKKESLDTSTAKIWFRSFEGSLRKKPPDKKYIYILSGILFDIFQIWMIIQRSMERKFISLRPFDDPLERFVQIHREYTLLLVARINKKNEEQAGLYIRVVYPDAPVNRT